MKISTVMISTLGFVTLIVPARATITFYSGPTGSAQYSSALTTASLTPSALETFTGALLTGNHEYDDSATGIDFLGFNNNSGNPGADAQFTIVSTALRGGVTQEFIKLTFPANVFAFSLNLTVPAGFGTFCANVGASFDSTCPSNSLVITSSSDTEFLGVVSSTAFTGAWIAFGSGTPQVVNFSDATGGAATPEGRTLVFVGSGLIFLGLLKRRMRLRGVEPSSQY
jgi:hypothetical protein